MPREKWMEVKPNGAGARSSCPRPGRDGRRVAVTPTRPINAGGG